MPVTVPSSPSSGQSETSVLIIGRNCSARSRMRESIASRIWCASQERRSGLDSQAWIASRICFRRSVEKYIIRSMIRIHMTNVTHAITVSTVPPSSMKSRVASYICVSAYMFRSDP